MIEGRRAPLIAALALSLGGAVPALPTLAIERADESAERRRAEQKAEAREAELKAALEQLRQQVSERELALVGLQRRVPPEPDNALGERRFRELAEVAGLTDFDVRMSPESEALVLAHGRPSPLDLYKMETSGSGDFPDVFRFLERSGLVPRLVTLERLLLQPAAKGAVRFEAAYGLPVYARPLEPEPVASAAPGRGGSGLTREGALQGYLAARLAPLEREVETHRARVDTLEAVIALLHGLDARRATSVSAALAAFLREAGSEALALSEVRVEGELRLVGLTRGAAAKARLRPALAAAGLELLELEQSPAGDCQAFVAAARVRGDGQPAVSGLPDSPFEAATDVACRPEAATPVPRLVAGAPADAGPPLLRLHEMDVDHVFRVLSEQIGLGFVVDADLEGRVSLEVHQEATLEEIWSALLGADIEVGQGPLHRVSRTGAVVRVPGGASHAGQPVNFSLEDADVALVLCALSRIVGTRVSAPPGLDRRMSIFLLERPWDEALEAIAAAADLTVLREAGQLWLRPFSDPGSASGAVDVCSMQASPIEEPRRLKLAGLDRLAPGDLRLVGFSHLEPPVAYAYGPGRTLWRLEAGGALFGARVTGIDASGVAFHTEGGALKLSFQP